MKQFYISPKISVENIVLEHSLAAGSIAKPGVTPGNDKGEMNISYEGEVNVNTEHYY